VYDIRKKLSGTIEEDLKEKFDVSTSIHFDIALEEGRGDLTTSAAMQLARQLGKKPADVAKAITLSIKKMEGVENVEIAGNGYVNVFLDNIFLGQGMDSVLEECFPKPTRDESPVIVDYFGPNVAKPLGIHHILSTSIGQAIINLYRHTGYPVIGWSYPGDYGTQFGKLAVAFAKWGRKKPVSEYSLDELLELYVRFHADAETDLSLEDEARLAFKKLEAGDSQLEAFRLDVVSVTAKALKSLCDRLHVHIDKETGESFYDDKMVPILEEGVRKGILKEGEGGALIVSFPDEWKLPPYLLRKGDGTTLYATRDLAMIRYRLDSCKPRAIYYVVDIAQSLHLKQLFATCKLLGWDLPELEHTVFGHMRFADAAMSTRKGTALKLEAVIDRAVEKARKVIDEHRETIKTDDAEKLAEMMGVGALVYGILSQNRKMDIVFDWDKMLSFEGNSAPYLQYSYARARSVLRKAGSDEIKNSKTGDLTPKDRYLLKNILLFPETLADARDSRMPHRLTNYLYGLCQAFNSFYNTEPILQAEKDLRQFRLNLTALTARVIKTGAEILTLRVPERM